MYYMYMSVQCVCGKQGEPGNEVICSWPIIIFDFLIVYVYILFVNVTNEQNIYP